MFHQAAAAVPNSSVKYPLPQYKTLASLPQPASLLSSYVGGFGTANNMPGNFPVNQSTASPTTTLGFDGSVPPHYKDGNQFISLQQQVTIAPDLCIQDGYNHVIKIIFYLLLTE